MSSDKSIKAYAKSIGLAFSGFAILHFTTLSPYVAWFLVVIGAVDGLNIYFRKPWWLARQMISQAANTMLTLTIDENGVSSKSFSVDSKISWAEIEQIKATKKGWLLFYAGGRSYLSNRCLSEEAKAFIAEKAAFIAEKAI